MSELRKNLGINATIKIHNVQFVVISRLMLVF